MSDFQSIQLGRIRLHVRSTKQFKTHSLSLFVGSRLVEEHLTANALLPFVLRRGTARTPETIRFRERLDDMYGAGFGFDIFKRGDSQIIQFRLDVINDRFVSNEGALLAQAVDLLGEVVTNPLLENGTFRASYVTAEKDTLRKRLEAVVNDKIRYASERCVGAMCEGEAYRFPALGRIEDLSHITPASLVERYREWLDDAVIDLYVVGDTTIEEIADLVSSSFAFNGSQEASYSQVIVEGRKGDIKEVTDRLEVTQGKLNIGLRTGVSYSSDDYPTLLVYNGILGAYPHSKLFVNVREKHSLAYYCSSQLDGHKGLALIQSGIEFDKYEQALVIIKEQLESLRQGKISELELTQTKAMLINRLKEQLDSAYEMIHFHFSNHMVHPSRSQQELLEEIQKVTPEQIVKVAQGVQIDTIYFLQGKEVHADA